MLLAKHQFFGLVLIILMIIFAIAYLIGKVGWSEYIQDLLIVSGASFLLSLAIFLLLHG